MNKTRRRYETLDFLRGVAAVCVVLFHFSTRLDLHGAFDHGYLAVDFFFILSGFIVERVYGPSLSSRSLTVKDFAEIRVIRVLPLVALGTVIAAVIDIARSGEFDMSQHLADIAVTALLGFLLLPIFWSTTLEKTTYPLNGPVWSLFLEMNVNILHAALSRIRNVRVVWICIVAASLCVMVYGTQHRDNIHVGTFPENFLLGFARVLLSYPIGILIAQSKIEIAGPSKWLQGAVLVAILAVPALPGSDGLLFDFCAVLIVFPLIIVLAAGRSAVEEHSALSEWSGNISFPLYAIHYPLVRAVAVVARQLALPLALNIGVVISGLVGFLILSSLAYRFYDVPVRRWLTRLARRSRRQATPSNGRDPQPY